MQFCFNAMTKIVQTEINFERNSSDKNTSCQQSQVCRLVLRQFLSEALWHGFGWFTPNRWLARQAVQRVQPPMQRSSRMLLESFSNGTDPSETQPDASASDLCTEGFRVQWCAYNPLCIKVLLHIQASNDVEYAGGVRNTIACSHAGGICRMRPSGMVSRFLSKSW
jgi:hypothetical protein